MATLELPKGLTTVIKGMTRGSCVAISNFEGLKRVGLGHGWRLRALLSALAQSLEGLVSERPPPWAMGTRASGAWSPLSHSRDPGSKSRETSRTVFGDVCVQRIGRPRYRAVGSTHWTYFVAIVVLLQAFCRCILAC